MVQRSGRAGAAVAVDDVRPAALPAPFLVIWFGQMISMIGAGMTRFALGVWVYQQTGSATLFAFTQAVVVLPQVLLLPFAGALVDRWDARRTMLVSDTLSAVCTLSVLGLWYQDALSVPAVYVVNAVWACIAAFQGPAWNVTTGILVRKDQLARAGGLLETGTAVALIAAPLLAGAITGLAGVQTIIAADMASSVVAVLCLLGAHVPGRDAPPAARPSLRAEIAEGWNCVARDRLVFRLLAYFAVINVCICLGWVLMTPAVLKLTTVHGLAAVTSVASSGMILGGMVLARWGGPRQKVLGTLGGGVLLGVSLAVTGAYPSVLVIGAGYFLHFFSIPFLNGCFRAVWQSRTPVELQGRVSAVTMIVSRSTVPFTFVAGGYLADHVFEPLMMPGGGLAGTAGVLLGTGPGRGMGALFVLSGIVVLLATWVAYAATAERRDAEELQASPAF